MGIEVVGGIMRMAGLLLSGSALVIGCEEAIADAIRPIKVQQMANDVKAAITTVAGDTGQVDIVVIKSK